ncbi:hypothetical protein BV898_09155 [Hypsibius exemplaris]|uniref:Uncharacterized protein n=1 Tax=Hypsibius exemplaris TaxID=2072580 RepID=A0A1W0WNP8_HYPEX|nr:hypothetical protein BV898_09155 [Hypsibius exemplaris]
MKKRVFSTGKDEHHKSSRAIDRREVPREDLPDFSALVAEERRRIEALNTTPESSSGFEEDEDTDEFRMRAKDLVEYMANYLDQLSDRRVTPAVKPGYLRPRLPEDPPMQGRAGTG